MAERAAQIASHLNYPKGLLAGQVAIITGSGQGIGAEAARLFANEGARVIVSDIDAGTDGILTESAILLIGHSKSKASCRKHK
jgi:3-oxoacyl-[acyl-carrier protein] reductase